jgi:hypothetical protein
VTENKSELTESKSELTESKSELTKSKSELIDAKQCEAEHSTFLFGHFIRKTRLSTTHLDRTEGVRIILVNI